MAMSDENETVDLSAAALVAQVQKQTGLLDWGGDGFYEGLHILLDACVHEANLSVGGQRWLAVQV